MPVFAAHLLPPLSLLPSRFFSALLLLLCCLLYCAITAPTPTIQTETALPPTYMSSAWHNWHGPHTYGGFVCRQLDGMDALLFVVAALLLVVYVKFNPHSPSLAKGQPGKGVRLPTLIRPMPFCSCFPAKNIYYIYPSHPCNRCVVTCCFCVLAWLFGMEKNDDKEEQEEGGKMIMPSQSPSLAHFEEESKK